MARTRKTDLPPEPSQSEGLPEPEPIAEEIELAEPVLAGPLPNSPPLPPPGPTPQKPQSLEPPRRRGLSVVFGGVLAALAGSAATILALPQLPEDLRAMIVPEPAETAARLSEQEATLADLTAQVATLAAAEPPPSVDIDALRADLTAAYDAAETTRTDLLANIDARLTALEKRPVDGGAASSTALDAFSRELEDLRGQIAANQTDATSAQGEIEAVAAAAAERLKAAEAQAAAVAADAEAAGLRAAARAAMSHVSAAIESGAPIASALADLTAAGIEIPAALSDQSQGVPSLQMLQEIFPAAARDALTLSLRDSAGTGMWSRFGAFLRSQTGARSLTPRAGDDPDAVLSRAEAALATGDLPAALAEVAKLPEAGQTRMAEWVGLAEKRLAAEAAVAELTATVN